jgi:folate-dependent phosphoribosylglycinamide formyltransferase PurN
MRPWVTFFSQTGSEIYRVSKKLNRVPDLIITNNQTLDSVNTSLKYEYGARILQISKAPSAEEYIHHIPENAFITLHGWLRIIPPAVCERYEIYNLHPANLVHNPNLKGKDPQKMAYEQKLIFSGNTIHRCIAELDAGEVLDHSYISIEGLILNEVIHALHKDATDLWYRFLKKHLK